MIISRKPFFVLADSKGITFINVVQIFCNIFFKKGEKRLKKTLFHPKTAKKQIKR
jgi:hypothetical protein